jgi:putative nucleotidyltransferase with HDIG domain
VKAEFAIADPLMLEVTSIIDAAAASLILRDLATKDPETYAHSERVSKLAVLIGHELHLDEDDLETLRVGALLHDIGKISVNAGVLTKPEKLESHEFEHVRTHSEFGFDFLLAVPGLERYAFIARSHHERWDGSGYPDRLAGEDIPLLARIVAVADSVDVMFQGRAYQKRRAPRAILDEISRSVRTHFDPMVVNALMSVWQAGELPL